MLDDAAKEAGALVFPAPLLIGVVADTHVHAKGERRLPSEVPALFARLSVDLILHAGDVNTGAVLAELADVAPTLAVRGNGDDAALQAALPAEVAFTVDRFTFVLIHGDRGKTARLAARSYAGWVDCVVYGHSHIPKIEQEGGTILFNPGSPTDRRWHPHFGLGLIRVGHDRIEPELVLFTDPRELANVR